VDGLGVILGPLPAAVDALQSDLAELAAQVGGLVAAPPGGGGESDNENNGVSGRVKDLEDCIRSSSTLKALCPKV
jgi:hypothetical protein